MIPRYARDEMVRIWTDDTKFQIWFEIEAHAASAMAKLGLVPEEAAEKIWERGKNARFDHNRILQIERETHHDVIAFLTHLTEIIGPEGRFLHQGMTSSDVLDSCLAIQLVRASDLLISDTEKLMSALKEKAMAHKHTLCVGRSHGIHAEPTSFGLKMAQAYAEFDRAKMRLESARKEIAFGAISGAVGTFANIDPSIEAYIAEQMGLEIEPISTQIIPRDRHAAFFALLAVVAGSLERLATEIRHLQRTEVGEIAEYFAEGQKGSSAMPHKRNPILSENVTGLARMVRAYALPAMENVALWHERDISHSSVERMIGPDATITLDFALNRMYQIIKNISVNAGQMQKNLEKTEGLIYSQSVMLTLIGAGLTREESYALVQKHTSPSLHSKKTFKDRLLDDKHINNIIDSSMISELFDSERYLRHIDKIYERVFCKK